MVTMQREAVFSPCGRYRYLLRRVWSARAEPLLLAVMLNPSIADAHQDDPTTRFMVNRAKDWGFGAYEAVNLFALISTDPKALKREVDPVGPENDFMIERTAKIADKIVVAWGSLQASFPVLVARATFVRRVLLHRCDVWCLGRNRDGSPRFPRAVRADVMLKRWGGGR